MNSTQAKGKNLHTVMPELARSLQPILRRALRAGKPVLKIRATSAPVGRRSATRSWIVSCFPFGGPGLRPKTVALMLEKAPESEPSKKPELDSEIQLRAILDNSPNPIFIKDAEGRYVRVSKKFERTFGIDDEQLCGRRDEEVFGPENAAYLRASDQEVLQNGAATVNEQVSPSMDGPRVNIVHKFPVSDSRGKVCAIGAIITDITDRKRGEERLRETEEQFRLLVEGVKEYAFFCLDPKGIVISWNAAAQGLREHRAEEILGAHFSCLYTSEDRIARKPEQALAIASARGVYRDEGWRLRKDGTRFWAEVTISAQRDERGKLRGFVNINRDASERKAAEEALRQLSSQLLKLQDEERRRLARELHDSTAQRLTAIAAYLAVVGKSSASLSRQSLNALSECRLLTEECHREIRTLSYLLHPPMLDEIGLPDALLWYCEGFTKRSGLPVDLKISSAIARLPSEVEGTLFRVVQECLTNIHRHSGSNSARIRLDRNGTKLILEVQDKGNGLPIEMLVNGKINTARVGVGIAGMQERIRNLHGQLEIESSKSGTVVRTLIPISEGDQ